MNKLLIANPFGKDYKSIYLSLKAALIDPEARQMALQDLCMWYIPSDPDALEKISTRMRNLAYYRTKQNPHKMINEARVDMRVNERHEIAYKTINRVYGLPLETRHKLSTLGGSRQVGLEIDQYPGLANPPRPITEETISEGILMVSFVAEALGSLPDAIIAPQASFSAAPYNGAKSIVFLGPAAERMELIELSP